jgi:hypothetical protein
LRIWASIAGGIVGLAVVVFLIANRERDAAEAGLGIDTYQVITEHPLGKFHYTWLTPISDLASMFQQRPELPKKILWLAASQAYAINDPQPGDANVTYHVFSALTRDGLDVVNASIPNAYPEEFEILLQYALANGRLDGLIIGAVYDDMRENGIRPWVSEAVPEIRAQLAATDHGRSMLAKFPLDEKLTDLASSAQGKEPDNQNVANRVEKQLTETLDHYLGMETIRAEGRAKVLLTLQKLRQFVESLRARYTRDLSNYRVPILPERYRANWEAWRDMLTIARARNVPVLIYIAPRPTDFFPYDLNAYETFKSDLTALAVEFGAHIINIEDVVPNDDWGYVDVNFGFPVRDPFHFNGMGHRLMADALVPPIRKFFLRKETPQ